FREVDAMVAAKAAVLGDDHGERERRRNARQRHILALHARAAELEPAHHRGDRLADGIERHDQIGQHQQHQHGESGGAHGPEDIGEAFAGPDHGLRLTHRGRANTHYSGSCAKANNAAMAQKKPSPSMTPFRPLLIRIAKLHAHLMISAVFGGIVLFALVFADWRLPTKLLTRWDAGVAPYLILVQFTILRCDIAHLRKRASEQDEGAFAILLLTIAAALPSLIAIVFELGGLNHATPSEAVSEVLLAMVTILLSWSFIHTIFSIHYAHEYYGERRDGKIGGLNFPEDNEPDYLDFLYFSLVVGLTSQVSDVAVTSKVIRRVVALHGVLSFFFNLTILALTVNMISNII